MEDGEEIQSFFIPTFHGGQFDMDILSLFGFQLPSKYHDTMIAAWCLYPDTPLTRTSKGMEQFSLEALGIYYDIEVKKYTIEKEEFNNGYTERLGSYCENDCVATYLLAELLLDKLQDDSHAWKLYTRVELPFMRVLLHMHLDGLSFDLTKVKQMAKDLSKEKEELTLSMQEMVGATPGKTVKTINKRPEEDVKEEVGCWHYMGHEKDPKDGRMKHSYFEWVAFNPGSTEHKIYALETLYDWKPEKFTKAGNAQVDKAVLDSLDYPLCVELRRYSEISKLLSTYINPAIENQGYIQTEWRHTGTITGRLSSSPNFQNLPARTKLGKQFRDCVISGDDDYVLIGADLSQCEPRILAWYLHNIWPEREDANILWNAFHSGLDPYKANADILGIPRFAEKTRMLATLYGVGPEKCTETINILSTLEGGKRYTQKDVEDMLKRGEEAFPSIQEFKEVVWAEARKNDGVVYTLYGRRLVYPDITSRDYAIKGSAERRSFNAPIQGTNADIMKILAIQMLPTILRNGGQLLALVHDEFLLKVPKKKADHIAGYLACVMNMEPDKSLLPGLPIRAEVKIGNSWSEIH